MQKVEGYRRLTSSGWLVRKIAAAVGLFYLLVVSPLYLLLLTMFVLPIYWTAYPFNWHLLMLALIYFVGYAPPLTTLWVICLRCSVASPESQFKLLPYQFFGLAYGLIVIPVTALYALATYPWTGSSSFGRVFLLLAIFATPGWILGAIFVHQHLNADDA
jgi:hypothetical protein